MEHDPDADDAAGVEQTPLVRRVVRDLTRLLHEDGAFVGGRLPAERVLATQLHVSRATIRKALQQLATSGTVTASSQSGWYVSSTPLSAPPQRLISFTEMAARRGQSVETRLLSASVRMPTLEESEFFVGSGGAAVLELKRLRLIAGAPTCLDRSVIGLWRAPSLAEPGVDWDDASLYAELSARDLVPTRSEFAVETALAGDLGATLEVAAGAPVSRIHERCYDQFGGPIMLGEGVYPAHAYQFRATLSAKGR